MRRPRSPRRRRLSTHTAGRSPICASPSPIDAISAASTACRNICTSCRERDLLTLEELDRLCAAFVARGNQELRITGGEPLVRHDVMKLFRALSRHLVSGALEELTLTTNGSQLARFAAELADCGVRRVNVSLDTLDPRTFQGADPHRRACAGSGGHRRRASAPASR